MEPSDFRYDPYNDIPTGVEITERHIIPANSPYHIRLNEVPQKESPSTITIKEITDIAESVTYGQTFSEVAANPAAGEFWPDCNTGANGDENWNTGLITFNAADAGKIIEVSYTGTGTLAGVNSNHWPSWYTDRGDGSDGDFVPTENTTISGVKNYKSVFIKEGITVTIDKYVLIKCQGAFINNGTLTATGKGAAGAVDAENLAGNGCNGANGGAGGWQTFMPSECAGGSGCYVLGYAVNKEVAEDFSIEILNGLSIGAGGGAGDGTRKSSGGAGGGAIVVVCNAFKNQGNIEANGAKGSDGASVRNEYNHGAGGGAGGSITIICNTLALEGTLSILGGAGGAGGSSNQGTGKTGSSGESGKQIVKQLGV